MKNRKRKLLGFLAVALGVLMLASTGTAVFAAKKTEEISDKLVTDGGNFNIAKWTQYGADTDVYKVVTKDPALKFQGSAGAWDYAILIGTGVTDTTKPVTVEFDVLEVGAYGYWGFNSWVPWSYNYGGGDIPFFYGGYEYQGMPLLAAAKRYSLRASTTEVKVSVADINEDGTYGEFALHCTKTKGAPLPETGPYFFNFYGHDTTPGGASFIIDNLIMKTDDETLFETDFSEELAVSSSPENGKVFLAKGGSYSMSALNVTNAAADNRIVTVNEILVDENMPDCFDVAAKLSLNTLPAGTKVGFAMGLDSEEQALDAADALFVYFENKTVGEGIETFINSSLGGQEGTAVSLGKDISGEEFFDIAINGKIDGAVTVTVLETAYSFTMNDVSGYIAITQSGSGTEYFVDSAIKVKNYSYRAGSGHGGESNFNTGYFDTDDFVLNSNPAQFMENPAQAEGIVIEDGILFYKGTTDNAFFGPTGTYADFILEFDYCSVPMADRPAMKAPYGYTGMGIYFGCISMGWQGGNGHALYLVEHNKGGDELWNDLLMFASYSETKNSTIVLSDIDKDDNCVARDGGLALYNHGNKFKIIVARGNVKVYAQPIVDGQALSEYSADDYLLLGEFQLEDTYGQVSICTTEAGYFKLDNFRMTPIDHPTAAGVQEKIDAYEDFKEIPDAYEPITLGMPVVTLDGKVASWAAISGATGYNVSVNGTVTKVDAETLSYTFDQAEAGDYVLKVQAIYEGDATHISDSYYSDEVTYKVVADDGCKSVLGSSAFGLIFAVGAALIVRKSKKNY